MLEGGPQPLFDLIARGAGLGGQGSGADQGDGVGFRQGRDHLDQVAGGIEKADAEVLHGRHLRIQLIQVPGGSVRWDAYLGAVPPLWKFTL